MKKRCQCEEEIARQLFMAEIIVACESAQRYIGGMFTNAQSIPHSLELLNRVMDKASRPTGRPRPPCSDDPGIRMYDWTDRDAIVLVVLSSSVVLAAVLLIVWSITS